MANNITSKAGRSRLLPRREPYWSRIETGLFVGYRCLKEGEGTWIARLRNDEGKQQYHSLGSISADKAFDEAQKLAQAWASEVGAGVQDFAVTVESAGRAYVEHQKVAKGERASKDAEGRFKRLVYGKAIGRIHLRKLKADQVRKWLHDQVADGDSEAVRRSKDSANRNLAALKAALNLAYRDRLVSTDLGWKSVVPFKAVGARRKHDLTLQQRKALIEFCPEDLQRFVKALLLTAARPGEIAAATLADFNPRAGALSLNGKTGKRTVVLSTEATAFFKEAARGRVGAVPLVPRADGKHWDKDGWKKPVAAAVKAARLPVGTVLYTLRHTAISELVRSGMDVFSVAKMAGTSVAMIEAHYGHLRPDHLRSQLDAVKLL